MQPQFDLYKVANGGKIQSSSKKLTNPLAKREKGQNMPLFMGFHKKPGITEEEIKKGWNGYKEAARKLGLRPLRAHYNAEQGVAFCETESPSAEDVKKAHESVQIPLEDLVEIKNLE